MQLTDEPLGVTADGLRVIGYNDDCTRWVVQAPFGLACYEGQMENGRFEGTHRGVARDWQVAYDWLRGEKVELVQVFDGKGRVDL